MVFVGCGFALLGIHVVLGLSYTGPGLDGRHQTGSGKQQAAGAVCCLKAASGETGGKTDFPVWVSVGFSAAGIMS